MSVLLGLGCAVPEHDVSQERAARHAAARCCETAGQREKLARIYAHSGVQRRCSVLPAFIGDREIDDPFFPTGVNGSTVIPGTAQRMGVYARAAATLAESAAREAIRRSGAEPGDFTHLVTCSCTGFIAPGVDISLTDRLDLPSTIERTHIGFMGCHAAINSLRIARAITQGDPRALVLLVAVELCSLHFAYGWNPQRIVANALFSDGAAAAAISGEARSPSETRSPLRLAGTAACIFPASERAMGWRIGDAGFEMSLSPRVPELLEARIRPWMRDWLAEHHLTIESIGGWAIHPGGPRVVESAARGLGIDRSCTRASEEVLARYGNMSSPTVLFILDRLVTGACGRPIVALAFGPGLSAEAALLV